MVSSLALLQACATGRLLGGPGGRKPFALTQTLVASQSLMELSTRPSVNQLASASVNRGRPLAQTRARYARFYKPELSLERRLEASHVGNPAKAQSQNDSKAGPEEGWRGGMNRAGGLVGVRRI